MSNKWTAQPLDVRRFDITKKEFLELVGELEASGAIPVNSEGKPLTPPDLLSGEMATFMAGGFNKMHARIANGNAVPSFMSAMAIAQLVGPTHALAMLALMFDSHMCMQNPEVMVKSYAAKDIEGLIDGLQLELAKAKAEGR